MKILAVSQYYITQNRAGGEMMFHEILKAFAKQGHTVETIATKYSGEPEELDGVKIYKGENHRDMLNSDVDIVITQFGEPEWVLEKAERLKILSLYIVHMDAVSTIKTLKEYKPDLVIFNTKWLQMKLQHLVGDSIVIHPPVYREQHETIKGDKITLVNPLVNKGADTFYFLANRFPDLPFLVVKGGYHNPKHIIKHRPNIEIIENTDNMARDVWSKTKVLLMPSGYESYGMVGVEAIASGIPVLANITPGLKESLSYAGNFVTYRNHSYWARDLEKLLQPDNYARASALAIKRSLEINPEIELNALLEKAQELYEANN